MLQLGGLGWEGYWKNGWNKFDFLLLITSIVDMMVALIMGEQEGCGLRCMCHYQYVWAVLTGQQPPVTWLQSLSPFWQLLLCCLLL